MSENSSANGAANPALSHENIEEVQEDTTPVDPDFVPKTISLRLTEGMIARLKAAGRAHNLGYQSLIKQIVRNWLSANAVDPSFTLEPEDEDDEPAAPKSYEPRPKRTRAQLLQLMRETIKRQELAVAEKREEDVVLLAQEIEQIKDDLADLENEGF